MATRKPALKQEPEAPEETAEARTARLQGVDAECEQQVRARAAELMDQDPLCQHLRGIQKGLKLAQEPPPPGTPDA